MQEGRCSVCGHECEYRVGFDRKLTKEIVCENCGKFLLTQRADEILTNTQLDTRRKIARFLYDTRNETDRLLTSETPPTDHRHGRIISLDSAENMYEDDGSPLDKYENTIRRVAAQAQTFGHKFSFAEDRWLVPTMDDEEAVTILRALRREGYLSGYPDIDSIESFFLTTQGLKYAAELGSQAKAEAKSVFVAASFSAELDPARNTICETIKELGYKPRIVNREPHNDLIDLKIYELIRESRFVVADLTWNRQSVYYEVGFAHGLGLEVVLTCRSDHLEDDKDDFRRVHFDLSHRNILVWKDEAELCEKLRDHIYQSFGALPVSQDLNTPKLNGNPEMQGPSVV